MRRRWRRRMAWGLASLVVAPILGVAVLWPLTPSVDSAGYLVRARLRTQHSPELTALPRPDRVAQALVATEDSRFRQMPGIDPISVVRVGLATLRREQRHRRRHAGTTARQEPLLSPRRW